MLGLFGPLPKKVFKHRVEHRPEVKEQTPKQAGHVLRMFSEWLGGKNEAMELLRDHAGMVVTFPSCQMIETLAMESQIVDSIERDSSEGNADRLAYRMNIRRTEISKIVRRETGLGVSERRRSV